VPAGLRSLQAAGEHRHTVVTMAEPTLVSQEVV
jgi:hypothetical protein